MTRSIAACVAVLVLAGCGSTSGSGASPTGPSDTPAASSRDLPAKVLVVIEENHSLAQMRAGMPFLAGLSEEYGYATHWTALAHPSEPNYLAIAGGSTFGVTTDEPPSINAAKVGDAPSVFGQALAAGKSAGTYAESMPDNCALTNATDPATAEVRYAVRHNPWTYFVQDRAGCLEDDADTTSFAADARHDALPDVAFLIPDLVHDAHSASLADADAWLEAQLAPVLASDDFVSGRLAVVVTADEDDEHSGNTVLTSVLSTRLHHVVVDTPLTHYSLTRFIGDVLGQTPLGQGRGAPDLAAAFGF